MEFNKDLKNRKMTLKREFNAPPEEVWKAWTESELLDQWWAPKPWKARTKNMDFREGGRWIYAMVGPAGEEHYARSIYRSIVPMKSFIADDAFCDEQGNLNKDLPVMQWKCVFDKTSGGTVVNVEISFEKESDLEKILEMGFKDGIDAAFGNLDEIFEKQYH